MKTSRKNADVVVVGGGVIGLSISYELLQKGVKVITVFPKSGDAESASLAAGAMLGAFGEVTADDVGMDIEEFEFRLAAQRRYPDWLGGLKETSGREIHQSKGTFIIANNDGPRDRATIKRMKYEADRTHEPAEWTEPDDVPGLKTSPGHAPNLCLHLKNEHSVDSAQLLGALLAAVVKMKGSTVADEKVVSITREAGSWLIKTQEGNEFATQEVVLAAGSRSFGLLDAEQRSEAELPEMYFGKGVSCIVSAAPSIPQTIRTPNRAFACGIHVVPRSTGQLYVGATNYMGVDHERERGVQPTELHGLFDETIHQINTDIRTSRIDAIRIGYRPIAMLRRPVIGKTRLPGLSVATGTYRNGILMAPLVAEIVADTLTSTSTAARVRNPFPVYQEQDAGLPVDFGKLADVGIRDIIAFLHEPRGSLPYNRAGELEKYVRTLFEISVIDDNRNSDLRNKIRDRLKAAPFNETMHKLFYEIVEQAD